MLTFPFQMTHCSYFKSPYYIAFIIIPNKYFSKPLCIGQDGGSERGNKKFFLYRPLLKIYVHLN